MKKSVIIGIVIIAVIIAGVGTLIFTRKADAPDAKNSAQSMSASQMAAMEKAQSQANAKQSTSNSVTIQDFAFSPANITVKQGTTVTWTNKDSATHTVTETDGKSGPKSDDLATGKSYVFTFNEVGTYKYHCSIHPSMVGTVTVTE